MSIETDYENLNGDVDVAVIRQYVNAGYHLSDGAIMGLCEEIDTLQEESKLQTSMLQSIAALASGWDADGALGPVEPLSWETVARMALDYARAALSSTRGQP